MRNAVIHIGDDGQDEVIDLDAVSDENQGEGCISRMQEEGRVSQMEEGCISRMAAGGISRMETGCISRMEEVIDVDAIDEVKVLGVRLWCDREGSTCGHISNWQRVDPRRYIPRSPCWTSTSQWAALWTVNLRNLSRPRTRCGCVGYFEHRDFAEHFLRYFLAHSWVWRLEFLDYKISVVHMYSEFVRGEWYEPEWQ